MKYSYFKYLFFCKYIAKCNLCLWSKAECSASLLQSSVSHDPSEIILKCWFTAQETFIITNVENIKQLCCLMFLFKLWYIFIFRILWRIESSKEQHLVKTEIMCKIMNVFPVTFDQFKAFLLNTSITFLKKSYWFLCKFIHTNLLVFSKHFAKPC